MQLQLQPQALTGQSSVKLARPTPITVPANNNLPISQQQLTQSQLPVPLFAFTNSSHNANGFMLSPLSSSSAASSAQLAPPLMSPTVPIAFDGRANSYYLGAGGSSATRSTAGGAAFFFPNSNNINNTDPNNLPNNINSINNSNINSTNNNNNNSNNNNSNSNTMPMPEMAKRSSLTQDSDPSSPLHGRVLASPASSMVSPTSLHYGRSAAMASSSSYSAASHSAASGRAPLAVQHSLSSSSNNTGVTAATYSRALSQLQQGLAQNTESAQNTTLPLPLPAAVASLAAASAFHSHKLAQQHQQHHHHHHQQQQQQPHSQQQQQLNSVVLASPASSGTLLSSPLAVSFPQTGAAPVTLASPTVDAAVPDVAAHVTPTVGTNTNSNINAGADANFASSPFFGSSALRPGPVSLLAPSMQGSSLHLAPSTLAPSAMAPSGAESCGASVGFGFGSPLATSSLSSPPVHADAQPGSGVDAGAGAAGAHVLRIDCISPLSVNGSGSGFTAPPSLTPHATKSFAGRGPARAPTATQGANNSAHARGHAHAALARMHSSGGLGTTSFHAHNGAGTKATGAANDAFGKSFGRLPLGDHDGDGDGDGDGDIDLETSGRGALDHTVPGQSKAGAAVSPGARIAAMLRASSITLATDIYSSNSSGNSDAVKAIKATQASTPARAEL